MPRKSAANDVVRMKAADVPVVTPGELAELHAAMAGPVDTSDIPEARGPIGRLKRDTAGRLPRRKSPIRDALLMSLDRLGMTRYRLWIEARKHCQTLPRSAVYEYIDGQREIRLPYAEALMLAAGLMPMPRKKHRSPRKQASKKSSTV
jgi:hypothetical protein